MLKKEWLSIWKDKKLTLSIAVMFFMPLLYAGMLLYAFWDPYNKLDALPVAIVNEDKGAVLEGEPLQLGDELIAELLDNKELNFIEVESDKANEGLLNEEYYLLVRVPEDFSQHATTLLDDQPKKIELEYYSNEGSNYLSSQIGGKAIETIRAKVNDEVAKTYATNLYDVITKLGNGYTDASDAANQINDGVTKVADGSQEMKDYLYQLAASTVTLSDGTSKLYDGVRKATTGASELATGASKLNDGATQIQVGMSDAASGAASVAQGVTDYTNGVSQAAAGHREALQGQQKLQDGIASLASNSAALTGGANSLQAGATELTQGFSQLKQQLAELTATMPEEQAAQLNATLASLNEGSQSLAAGASSLAEGTTQLSQGAASIQQNGTAILNGQQQVAQGLTKLEQSTATLQQGSKAVQQGNATLAEKMAELTAGTSNVVAGANALRTGLVEIGDGSSKLSSGTAELASKSNELAQGSEALVDGSKKLKEGSADLASSLADAGEESSINVSDDKIDMTINPVELKETVYNEVENYGVGFAPYFISLGLFVGALLLTNVYPFVQPAVRPTGVWNWFASKSSVIVLVGAFQMLLTYVLLRFGLGVQVENDWWLIATICISSFAFLAIVQVLTVLFGDVGRFIALIFLVLQLAGSAGTFPVELLPTPLQTVHNWLPMSYSVHAFRAAISTNDTSVLTHSLMVLGTIGIICVIISFAFFALLYKKRYSKPQEA